MKTSTVAATLATLACSTLAAADIITLDNPYLGTNASLTSLVEARGRLDNGSGQSWKTAVWGGSTSQPIATGGNKVNVWGNGVAERFEFTYDAETGNGSWRFGTAESPSIVGAPISFTMPLTLGSDLLGFRIMAKSSNTGAGTNVSNLRYSVNGGDYFALGGLDSLATMNNQMVDRMGYFTAPVSSFSITGETDFTWSTTQSGERSKFSIYVMEGTIPAPAGALLAGLSMIMINRRRRGAASTDISND